MDTQEEKLYDIFAGDPATNPLWLAAVSGLTTAVSVMNCMAAKQRGRYFVLDEDSRVVAQIDRREARLSA